jgi:hypothetical protein
MNETEQESSKSLADALPPEERSWPPHPPLGEPEESGAKIVAKGLASAVFGIPVAVVTALLEAPYHYRLKLK